MGAARPAKRLVTAVEGKARALRPCCRQVTAAVQIRSNQLVVRILQAFADGKSDDFLDVELDLDHLTTFARRVIGQCRKIKFGSVLTYGQLASKAKSPNAARAVGSVMRKNRFPLIVPCHRVVGAGISLGGYSAPDGLDMKRRLLAMEGSL